MDSFRTFRENQAMYRLLDLSALMEHIVIAIVAVTLVPASKDLFIPEFLDKR